MHHCSHSCLPSRVSFFLSIKRATASAESIFRLLTPPVTVGGSVRRFYQVASRVRSVQETLVGYFETGPIPKAKPGESHGPRCLINPSHKDIVRVRPDPYDAPDSRSISGMGWACGGATRSFPLLSRFCFVASLLVAVLQSRRDDGWRSRNILFEECARMWRVGYVFRAGMASTW